MIQAARKRIAMERAQEPHLATEEDILCTSSRSTCSELDPKSSSASPAASDSDAENGRGATCNCHHREASCLRCSFLRLSLHAHQTHRPLHRCRSPSISSFCWAYCNPHLFRAPSCASDQLCGAFVWYHPQVAEDSRSTVAREDCTPGDSSRERAPCRCRTSSRGLKL